MTVSTFYERWAALPPGTKFRTPDQPGLVFMKTSKRGGADVVCLTDGRANRLPNLVNPLHGFDAAIEVVVPATLTAEEAVDSSAASDRAIKTHPLRSGVNRT